MWRFWQKHGHLGEARRRLDGMAAAPWSREDPRLRARLVEALGGVCWWQGDVAAMQVHYEEALAIWEGIGDDRELANAYYNASFSYAVGPDGKINSGDPEGKGEAYVRAALEAFRRIGDSRGEANALWGLGTMHYFKADFANSERENRTSLELFRAGGDRTMESWSRHMLGLALIAQEKTEEAKAHVAHAVRHFHAAGDVAGLSLTLYDLSAIAVQEGDLERAARLRGAATNLSNETGTTLGVLTEDAFEDARTRPSVREQMSVADVERLGAEGAAMTLDQLVAYALEGAPPDEDDE
jgi:non-specific serine/threonine protein kinase